MNIGRKLKELRLKNEMRINEVVSALKSYGKDIAGRTIYGYENDSRMPNADVFILLCLIYESRNISEFYDVSSVKEDIERMEYGPDQGEEEAPESRASLSESTEEALLLQQYRSLDHYGKLAVAQFLTLEMMREETIKDQIDEAVRKAKEVDE